MAQGRHSKSEPDAKKQEKDNLIGQRPRRRERCLKRNPDGNSSPECVLQLMMMSVGQMKLADGAQ